MKPIKVILIMLSLAMIVVAMQCKTATTSLKSEVYIDSLALGDKVNGKTLTFSGFVGKHHNHPTFVIWVEDMDGSFVKTLFITKSYATAIFGHANVNDSTWLPSPGESVQPSALPYWTYKKGQLKGGNFVPTKSNPYIDAYTGATPGGDFQFTTKNKGASSFRILMEVNQPWDFNDYWTNAKFKSEPYRHSAQPSLVYAVTIDDSGEIFYLNPVGHGDPEGKSGKLYTDLSGFTTALQIFNKLMVQAN